MTEISRKDEKVADVKYQQNAKMSIVVLAESKDIWTGPFRGTIETMALPDQIDAAEK
ncbi:hypothetical protein RND71_015431 [Anisodus tanguticus]|uniref:Uncharacterized protein n=1 Tax=Anisodus tanguticus TaxID=243964 RepID=A0AAE1VBT1_9SOLA|nr:hypothetical protein RND71_015431 [Anisodus tanguticus]